MITLPGFSFASAYGKKIFHLSLTSHVQLNLFERVVDRRENWDKKKKLALGCLKNPKVTKKNKNPKVMKKNSKKIQRDFSSAYAEAG